jgi:probable rRNA maturation factor
MMPPTDMNDVQQRSGGDPSEPEPAEPGQPRRLRADSEVALDTIEVLDPAGLLHEDESELIVDALGKLVERVGRPCVRCAIEIVNDRKMTLLHRRWMNDDSTTDVLTFPMSAPNEPIDVDIAVCLDEAERRAGEFGHDRLRELVLYALHGLLHVIGHDDHDADDFRVMHDEEDRLLDAVGLGRVFAAGGHDPSEGHA